YAKKPFFSAASTKVHIAFCLQQSLRTCFNQRWERWASCCESNGVGCIYLACEFTLPERQFYLFWF
ncbi:MAG: hypothetical protein LH615_03080, partial [Ferruginibacter sp.]|nr:hypothetical protein [Ferruginibacter sp.]